MASNPEQRDQQVRRAGRESGKPAYPFIILAVVVIVAVIGIIVTL